MRSVSHLRAIVYAIAGFAAWVLCDTFAKLLGGLGVAPFLGVASCGVFGTIAVVLYAGWQGKLRSLWPRQLKQQLLRSLLGAGSTLTNFIAVKHMPLTMFYIVIFMAPMVIAILASMFLKERLTALRVVAIIAGFTGVVIALNPLGHMEGEWIGYLSVGIGVFFFAANAVWLRAMTQNESFYSLAFVSALVQAVIGSAACLAFPPAAVPPVAVSYMIGMGVLNVVGMSLNFMALKHTTAATVSQFHYTQIIWGSILGYVLWHEVPTWHFAIGAAIIIASGCYIAAQAHKIRGSANKSAKNPV
jgi:drug/metabolite transporter (DMT)-like permease